MKEITIAAKGKYLPTFLLCTLFILLPYFYEQRLETEIFNIDFYLFWFVGCFCWLSNTFLFQFSFNRLQIVVLLACVYVLLLFFTKSHSDVNSIKFLITLFSCIGIICYLISIKGLKHIFIILTILLLSFFIQIFIGYRQAINSDYESLSIKGEFFNSGFFGNYLTSIIPLLFSSFLTKSTFKWHFRILFLYGFIASMVLLILTFARAAIIGSVIGCLIITWPYLKKDIRKKLVIISFIVIIIFSFIGLYKLKPASALGRITIYKVCLIIIKEHPFFGIGPNRFSAEYNNYQAAYFQKENVPVETQLLADNTYEAFDSILQILVEFGIVGFLFLTLILYQIIKLISLSKKQNKNWLYKGSYACIISILISSLFSNPFHVTPILLIFSFHLSIILPERPFSISSFKLNAKKTSFIFIILFTLNISVCYYAFSLYKAEITWKVASDLALYDNFGKAQPLYKMAYKNLKFNGNFLYNYGAEAYLAGNYYRAITLLEQSQGYLSSCNLSLYLGESYTALNQFAYAEKNYLKAIYIAPSHIYSKYLLIKLYLKWNKLYEAKMWINKTIRWPVKIETSFTDSLIHELKVIRY